MISRIQPFCLVLMFFTISENDFWMDCIEVTEVKYCTTCIKQLEQRRNLTEQTLQERPLQLPVNFITAVCTQVLYLNTVVLYLLSSWCYFILWLHWISEEKVLFPPLHLFDSYSCYRLSVPVARGGRWRGLDLYAESVKRIYFPLLQFSFHL